MPFFSSAFVRRTFVFILGGGVALLAIVLTTVWLASRTIEQSREVVDARAIRTLASTVLVGLLDAETGQRGFLLAGEQRYLGPYDEAVPKLKADLARLRTLVAGDPEAVPQVDRLIALVEAKLGELASTVDLEVAGRREAALDLFRTDRGKALMDESRIILNRLIDVNETGVNRRIAELQAAAATLTWTAVAGGGLIVLFAAGAAWTVARHTRDLIAARREVDALNVDLEGRVGERTAALTRANDEIQRFAYIVSHDLRSPLVNIMGFTSELEVGMGTLQQYVAAEPPDEALTQAARTAANADLPEAVGFIRASTAKMDRLINAILRLSREGRRKLNPEPVDLERLIAAAVATVQHQIEASGARIELPSRFPTILTDRLALEQVFGNLLDNAVKYLSPDRPGVITVGAEAKGGAVTITVADNGRGIPPQDHERIFELFRRSGVQDRPGEGIGLAHVRALVRRLGGDVTVQSRLGEGSTFQIHLSRSLSPNEDYFLS